jgi:tetratricopeptide (TPR) repeat protein
MADSVGGVVEKAIQARREKRFADAKHLWVEAVEYYRNSGQRPELIRALRGLGQIERDLGYNDAALTPYEEAVSLCRENHDPLLLAHTVRHLGDIHLDAERFNLAEPCYHEALALYRSRQQTNRLDLANAIRPLAILMERTGHTHEAIKLWTEAKELYQACHVRAGVQESSRRLTELSSHLKP